MDKLFGSWWLGSHHVTQTPKPTTFPTTSTESALSLARSKISTTLRTALSFLNESTYSFGINVGQSLSTGTGEERGTTATAPTTTSAATARPLQVSFGISGLKPEISSMPVAAATTTTSHDSFYTLPSFSSLLASAASATSPAAINSTVVAAADSLFKNISLLGTAHEFTEDELFMFGWGNSSILLNETSPYFDGVSLWNDSSIAAINATILAATAIISTANGTFIFLADETTWQLIEIIAKSIILGFVILATVIGK